MVFLAMVLPGMVLAGDWTVLGADQVGAALSARVLQYEDGATQNFYADGRTFNEAGGESWGSWRIDGDQYCSQWPPSDHWACYRVERSAGGLDLRFIAEDGSITEGRHVDLN